MVAFCGLRRFVFVSHKPGSVVADFGGWEAGSGSRRGRRRKMPRRSVVLFCSNKELHLQRLQEKAEAPRNDVMILKLAFNAAQEGQTLRGSQC